MNYTFCVITKIPPHHERGNMSDTALVRDHTEKEEGFPTYREIGPEEDMGDMKANDLIWAKLPVFDLGEILILDSPYGREVCGRGRKPSKWFVEFEHFTKLEYAVKRSQSLLQELPQEEPPKKSAGCPQPTAPEP
jgi:hypothetical protein